MYRPIEETPRRGVHNTNKTKCIQLFVFNWTKNNIKTLFLTM